MQPLTIQFWMDGGGNINYSQLPVEILKKPTDILFWEWFHVEVKTGHTPTGIVEEIKKFWYDNVFTAVVPETDEASDLTMEIIGSLLGMFSVDGLNKSWKKIRAEKENYGDEAIAEICLAGDADKSMTWSGHELRKRYKFQDMDISIESPAGTLREGKDPDGKKWRSLLYFDYGYIRGTKGVDGDHVDCFIGANKDSDKVFVIHQKHVKTGKFDEDKVMLGWLNKTDAVADYLKNYNRSDMYSGVAVMTIDEFKKKAYATAKKPMMIKSKIKAHSRKMQSGKVAQVREHSDSRTKKPQVKKERAGVYQVEHNNQKFVVMGGTSYNPEWHNQFYIWNADCEENCTDENVNAMTWFYTKRDAVNWIAKYAKPKKIKGIKVLDDKHLTAGNKKAIIAIMNQGLKAGKVGRTNYYIKKSGKNYECTIKQMGRGIMPVPGEKLRESTYKCKFSVRT